MGKAGKINSQRKRESEAERNRERERERGGEGEIQFFPPLILRVCGVSALDVFPCLQKDWCLCAHADDFDSQAVSAETRPINCNGFRCLAQVLTVNILAGIAQEQTRHPEIYVVSERHCNSTGRHMREYSQTLYTYIHFNAHRHAYLYILHMQQCSICTVCVHAYNVYCITSCLHLLYINESLSC